MPWHIERKKDATNCEKPRGVVSRQRSGGIRMGEPDVKRSTSSTGQYITCRRTTQGIETSQYLKEKKTKVIPKVVASEIGEAQTSLRTGVVGPQDVTQRDSRMRLKAQRHRVQAPQTKFQSGQWNPEYGEARGTLSEAARTIWQG